MTLRVGLTKNRQRLTVDGFAALRLAVFNQRVTEIE